MKTITLNLPDKLASIFEAMPSVRRTKVALLAAILAQSKESTDRLFEKIDERVVKSGASDKEIDQLLDEIS